MKQFSARLLVFLCIISFSPIKEVVKAPLVVVHYLEHLADYPEMTWDQFYYMHYTVDIHFDEDYDKDRQLPFKSYEYSSFPFFVISENSVSEVNDFNFNFDFKNALNTTYLFVVKTTQLHGIFHPPKFV